jgi:hypothetical protein
MALLELEKLRKDINILFGYVRCLMNKSNETSPLVATEWSSNHSVVTGNPYIKGSYVFYNGHVYKCLFDNDGILPTNTTYWLDLGEGHLLAEEQSDWDATEGRAFIRNKPQPQDLYSVLEQGDEAPDKGAYIKEIGLWDSFAIPFGYAKIYADKGRIWFQSKLGVVMASIRDNAISFKTGIYEYTINIPNATANRTATFQDKNGTVAYLSDIQNITYKSYVAIITQFGTNAPTVDNVLENTIGAITFSYGDAGEFLINSSGLFINNKTAIIVSPGRPVAGGVELGTQIASTNSIILYSRNNLGLLTNSIISSITIEIRVYN